MEALKEILPKNLDRESLLRALRLQARRDPIDTLLPALGIFAAGMLLGTGLGLLVAPKPGRTLRRQLRRGANELVDKAQETAQEAKSHLR